MFFMKKAQTVAKQLKNLSFSQISKSASKLDFQLKMNSLSWKNCETSEFGAKFENIFTTRFCVIRNTRFTARTLENVFYERKAQNSRKTVQNLNFLSNLKIILKTRIFVIRIFYSTTKTLKNLFLEKSVKSIKKVQNLIFWSNNKNNFKTRFALSEKLILP